MRFISLRTCFPVDMRTSGGRPLDVQNGQGDVHFGRPGDVCRTYQMKRETSVRGGRPLDVQERPPINLQRRPGDVQRTSGGRPVDVQGTFEGHQKDDQWTSGGRPKNIKWNFNERPGDVQWMSIGPQMDVQRTSYGRPVWTSKRRKLALQWFLVGLGRPLVVHIETSYKTGSLERENYSTKKLL